MTAPLRAFLNSTLFLTSLGHPAMTALSTDPKQWNVGLIGYGEVGRILAEDLRQQEVQVAAYDIKLRSDQTGGALRDHAGQHGVTLTASHADLAAQSDFIVSAVT